MSTNLARREWSVISSITIRCLVRQEQGPDIHMCIYPAIIPYSFTITTNIILSYPRVVPDEAANGGEIWTFLFRLLDLIFNPPKNNNNNCKTYIYICFRGGCIYLFDILLFIVVYLLIVDYLTVYYTGQQIVIKNK